MIRNLFITRAIKDQIEEVGELRTKIKDLKNQRDQATEALETLKLKKRLEQEEITHMQRINEERCNQDVEKKKIELERKHAADMNKFKEEQRVQLVDSLKQFHTKIEDRFTTELSSMKDLYRALMERLPNVNYEITKHVGDPKFIEAKGKLKS